MIRRSLIACFTLALLAATAYAEGVKTGSPAPGFTLTDINGQQHSLADYKGKYVVLEWFNQGCPFVKKFYKPGKMQELQAGMTGQDVVWLTIDSTGPQHRDHLDNAAAKKLWKDWKISSTAMLMDSDGKVGHLYGATNTPQMFVVDPQGVLIYQGAIDDHPDTDSASIGDATNYVEMAVAEAKSGKAVSRATTHPYGCSVKYAD